MARIAPVGPGDAVRARVPDVLSAYAETRDTVLRAGIVDQRLKDLCALYLADDEEVVRDADDPERFEARERAALAWTHAVAYDSDRADDALWQELHAHFSEPELVELGYFIAFTIGQQHWVRTLGIAPLDDR